MAKQDMNVMVESFFAKKEKLVSENILEQLVRNQFRLLKEAAEVAQPRPKGMKKSLTYASIPEISVSEIGWSAIETTDSGAQIASPQRKQLKDYFDNISGTTLEEKIRFINRFYETKDIKDLEANGIVSSGDPRTVRIQKIISYLVFLKTLTTIITNFNAASAGFSFESFLGVLLNGTQVPTAHGTIADMIATIDGKKEYISLKLYAEKGVKVGGSFTDLTNDLVNPQRGKITYVVAMKDLAGEALNREGKIGIAQFYFDLENVANIINISSTKSKTCISFPKKFIEEGGNGTDFSALKKTTKPEEEIGEFFDDSLKQLLKPLVDEETFNKILALTAEGERSPETYYTGSEKEKKLGFSTPNDKLLAKKLRDIFGATEEKPKKPFVKPSKKSVKGTEKETVHAPQELPVEKPEQPKDVKAAPEETPVEPETIETEPEETELSPKMKAASTKYIKNPKGPKGSLYMKEMLELLEEARKATKPKIPLKTVQQVLSEPFDSSNKYAVVDQAKERISLAYKLTKEFAKGTDPAKEQEVNELQEILKKTGGFEEDTAKCTAFYNKLTPELKKKALKNSYGYINIEQFDITRTQLDSIENKKFIGTISVGRKSIENIINIVSDAINQEVFEIFDSLNQLTTNINTYFSTGLNDDSAADMAQAAALEIDKKTEDIQATAKLGK